VLDKDLVNRRTRTTGRLRNVGSGNTAADHFDNLAMVRGLRQGDRAIVLRVMGPVVDQRLAKCGSGPA
jgi:hypothetical protein